MPEPPLQVDFGLLKRARLHLLQTVHLLSQCCSDRGVRPNHLGEGRSQRPGPQEYLIPASVEEPGPERLKFYCAYDSSGVLLN